MSSNDVNLEEAAPSTHSKLSQGQLDEEERKASWQSGMFMTGAGAIAEDTVQALSDRPASPALSSAQSRLVHCSVARK